MEVKAFEYIKKYASGLAEIEGCDSKELRAVVSFEGETYQTVKGADFAALSEGDVEKISGKLSDLWIEQALVEDSSPIGAVVVSRTEFCTRACEKDMVLRPCLDDMAQIIGHKVVAVEYDEKAVRKALSGAAGCFVKGKYTITTGRSLYEAMVALTVLEKSAEVNLLAEKQGGGKSIILPEAMLMRMIYKKKYSKAEQSFKQEEAAGADSAEAADRVAGARAVVTGNEEISGQEEMTAEEAKLRQSLVDFGNKLVETGLVQGTWGNLSVRLDDRYMLVTPSGLDYARLTAGDIVKVEIETLEYEGNLKPTSEKGIHASIYKLRDDVGAVIHTHSKYCSVFAAARKDLEIQGSAEETFGKLVKCADYALPGTKSLKKNTAKAFGQSMGCIMANHGMVCGGRDIQEAFDNCRMLEGYAEQRAKGC
ncbi:MAG: class II aldolase/adducin family protein [Eubacteriaceae bacterium]|nr:class II aldolase/adducin family protein [Eubacteriaceae bacterium]